MSVWDTYEKKIEAAGKTKRERTLNRTQSYLSQKLPNSLSWKEVLIDGVEQSVSVLNQKKDLTVKKICAMPGEPLRHGGIVDFANSKWLITELDADNEVYSTGLMRRCNYLLKWINTDGKIIEKWCVVEDGTKYLIGERAEDMMSIGDARVAVTVGKDSDTVELGRGKRFLIDDMDSDTVLAYQITKPNKLYNIYNGNGVFRFILNEVEVTDDDNTELRIADYYNWKPSSQKSSKHKNQDTPIEQIVESAKKDIDEDKDRKKVWL